MIHWQAGSPAQVVSSSSAAQSGRSPDVLPDVSPEPELELDPSPELEELDELDSTDIVVELVDVSPCVLASLPVSPPSSAGHPTPSAVTASTPGIVSFRMCGS
jgi:hypothetical protein